MTTHPASATATLGTDRRAAITVGALAGLGAGMAFAIASMLYAYVQGPGLWAPPRMIATILGFEMAASFALVPVILGLILHFMLSAGYGAAFALVLSPLRSGMLLAAGAAYGLVLYVVNFHGFTQLEQFAAFRMMAGNWFEIAVHVAYGLMLAAGLLWWRRQGTLPD